MLLPVLSASPVWRALPLWLFHNYFNPDLVEDSESFHNCAIDDDDDDVGGWCYPGPTFFPRTTTRHRLSPAISSHHGRRA